MDEGSLTGNKQSTAPSPDIVNPINKTYPTPSSSSSNQGTTATTATAAASKCRLLWRGKFIQDRNGYSGIAIVAHLFAVPSLLSPAHAAHAVHAGPSPFDDPSSAFDTTAATDLCLGLEMMKGQDLKVLGQVYVNAPNDPSTANARHQALQQSKGKMRMELEEVRVETPTDVRVYVDQRCSETVNWLEKAFCDSDRLGIGMRLDLAGEEVIIFAAYPPLPKIIDPLAPKPALTLLLGRAVQIRVRKPRPDDPLPRESLFAKKLRRTTSMPALGFDGEMSFGFPPSKPKPSKKLKASKTLTGLLNGQKQSITNGGATTIKSKSVKIRSKDATVSNKRGAHSPAKGAGTPGRKGEKRMRRSESLRMESGEDTTMKMIKGESDEEDDFIAGSPTPSVATTFGAMEDIEEDQDLVMDLPLFGGSRASSVRLGMETDRSQSQSRGEGAAKRSAMQRSSSLPVGLFGVIAPPPPLVKSGVSVVELEAKNKATLRKLVLAGLTNYGVDRNHVEFKDIFSITLKGVQFALRSTLKSAPIDRTLATMIIATHNQMYVAPSVIPPRTTLSVSTIDVKQE